LPRGKQYGLSDAQHCFCAAVARRTSADLARIAVLVAAVIVTAAGGCRPSAEEPNEVLILCGTSFRPPVEALAKRFEAETGSTVLLSFGGSEDLLPIVKNKAQGDLFVTHDPYLRFTEEAGALLGYAQVGHMVPVIVVKKGNPLKIQGYEDLARPGVRVVLPDPNYATAGKMVFELLDKRKLRQAVMENVGNAQVRSHKDVAEAIRLGHRDAGVMWNGVVHGWRDDIEVVPGHGEKFEEIRVAVIGLSYSAKRQRVEQFLKFAETHGPKVFAEYGYVK
jgi:molybdate transport system substrate-binding protein